jgi:hypothetical protein
MSPARLAPTWGAPDCSVCIGQCPVLRLAPSSNRPLSGKTKRDTAIIHRTVRWATGLSGEPTVPIPTVGSAISGRHVDFDNSQNVAPDCPVRHRTVRCAMSVVAAAVGFARKGRKLRTIHCPVVHRTVRCAHGQKATMTFQMELQRLLADLGL